MRGVERTIKSLNWNYSTVVPLDLVNYELLYVVELIVHHLKVWMV